MNENPRPYLAVVYDGAFEDGYSAISADGDCLFGEGKTKDEAIAMLEWAMANHLHTIREWKVEAPPPQKREQLENLLTKFKGVVSYDILGEVWIDMADGKKLELMKLKPKEAVIFSICVREPDEPG